MKPAAYRDIQPDEIPVVDLAGGGQAKVIAGTLALGRETTAGPIQGLTTDLLYLDVALPAGARFTHPVGHDYHAYVYAYEGGVAVGPAATARRLDTHQGGVLPPPGAQIEVTAGNDGARFLVLAGRPLREPVAQYGPFVMNTSEEIEQAIIDFQSGNFGQ